MTLTAKLDEKFVVFKEVREIILVENPNVCGNYILSINDKVLMEGSEMVTKNIFNALVVKINTDNHYVLSRRNSEYKVTVFGIGGETIC